MLNQAQAYGNHLESSCLILTSFMFVVVGVPSARRLHTLTNVLQQSSPATGKRGSASQQRFMILAAVISLRRSNSVVFTTTLVIFISQIINAAYATLYSIASAGENYPNCQDVCDASCQSAPAVLNHAPRLTPALACAVLMISLVVAPLLALANIMRGRIWSVLLHRGLPGGMPRAKVCGAAMIQMQTTQSR